MWRFLLVTALVACGEAPLTRSGPPMGAAEATPTLRGGQGGDGSEADGQAVTTPIQIVTGTVVSTVEAYQPSRDGLVRWVTAHGGHLGDESAYGDGGRAASGTVVVRLPPDQVEPLVSWLRENGEVRQVDTHRTDVTEQWVDQTARIGALEGTRHRLEALVADRTATLADVLAAETELSRVQGDLESLQARQRVLADQVGLASMSVTLVVRQPDAAALDRALGPQVADTVIGSVHVMGVVGRGLILIAAALSPWVLVGTAGAGALFAAARVLFRRR